MLTWIDSELGQAVEAVQRAEFPEDFAEADAAAVRRRGGKKREERTLFKDEEEELSRRKEEGVTGVAGVAEDVLWCQRESGKLGGVEEGSVSERGSGGGCHALGGERWGGGESTHSAPRIPRGAQKGDRFPLVYDRYSVYLLYWYKNTNTDAQALCCWECVSTLSGSQRRGEIQVLSLLALLVQKYKY